MSKNRPPSKADSSPSSQSAIPNISVSEAFLKAEATFHSGPLPDPETLRLYDQYVPGAASRIIQMAENEQQHIHSLMSKGQQWTLWRKQIGQFLGFMIAALGLFGGAYLALHGHDGVAAVMTGSTIISLVGLFVREQQARKKKD